MPARLREIRKDALLKKLGEKELTEQGPQVAEKLPKDSRTIMLRFPVRGVKPKAIRLEFHALPEDKARLHYEETFGKPEKNVFALTTTALPKLFGNMFPTMKPFSDKKTRTVGFDVEDDISKVASYAATEFLIQAFKNEDATIEFWNIVDSLQQAFSMVHVDLWPKIPPVSPRPPPPLVVICGKCGKAFNTSPTINRDFVCPYCGHKPERPKEMPPKSTNEGLRTFGKALDVPSEGMANVRCGECGFEAPAPNAVLEKDAPFTCPKCEHIGPVKEGRF